MKKTIYIILFALLCVAVNAFAGLPSVSQMEVTDVTPASFAVTWVSSEPATGALALYQSDCVTPITGLVSTSEGNDTTGVIRVTVSGLSADAVYCYQASTVSKSTAEVALSPSQPAAVLTARMVVRSMTTGTALVPFGNDLLRAPAVSGAADGVLEVLYLTGGKDPVSLLLTNDITKQYFNMNNLFDAATGSTFNLTGGESVRISERHGISGCVIDRFRKVPADLETTGVRDLVGTPRIQDIDFNGTVNILDVLRAVGGAGTAAGDVCYNSDLDMMGHNKVDSTDVQSVIGSFDAIP
ncbi:MAG: hypothetical protein AABZ15_01085 [Nitrospirota bacterium]